MKQRSIAGLLGFMLFVIMLTSCGSQESKRLAYDLGGEPDTLDPQCATDPQALTVINNIFEGLMSVDQKGNLVEGVAESYQVSEDGLYYQFELRSDLSWSNGYSLTAYDFEFAFRRLFDPKTKSKSAESFYCIKNSYQIAQGEKDLKSLGVKALSDTRLVIELDYANPSFLEMLTTAAAMPCNQDFFEKTEGEYGLELKSVIANGSFVVTSWKHGESIRLSRNSSYWDASNVSLDGVNLSLNYPKTGKESESTQLGRFLDGKTDLYLTDDIIDPEILTSGDFKTEQKMDNVWGLLFNCDSEYGKSGNLRRAIAFGIDRSRLEGVLPDELDLMPYLIPSDLLLGDSVYRKKVSVSPLEFDSLAARDCLVAALNELKIPSLNEIEIIMPQTDYLNHSEYFSYLSQGLQKELELYFSVTILSEKEYWERVQSGEFTIALTRLEPDYRSAVSIFSQFMPDSEKNYSSYQNKNFSGLIENIQVEGELSQVETTFSKAEQILLQDAVFIPLYEQPSFMLWNSSVSGAVRNSFSGFMTFRYINLG